MNDTTTISSISNRLERMKQRQNKTVFNDQTAKNLNESNSLWFPPQHKETHVIAPNTLLRSALFGVVKRGARKEFRLTSKNLDGDLIASWQGHEIYFHGIQLDQADFDTWMACLELCSAKGFGNNVTVNRGKLLKSMSRNCGKSDYLWLHASIKRLQKGHITIKSGRFEYSGNLVLSYLYDHNSAQYVLKINHDLSKLFIDGYTLLEKENRKKLKNGLTKWLYNYLNSHDTRKKPHVISIEKLYTLSGSSCTLKKFRFNLQNSIKQLASNQIAKCEIKDQKLYAVNL